MKKTNIIYWILTSLFSLFMIFTAIPDILNLPEAVEVMTTLGYPLYFTPFIGYAKILGAIAILIPGFSRIKEWAYAGLVFDLIGATYSQICSGIAEGGGMIFMLIMFLLAFGSYFYYHKKRKEESAPAL